MKKKSKIIAAAMALLSFSTAATISGTVAWFTAANVVSVSGMSIQAEAEQGIVISNEAKSEWKISATASHNGADKTFVPTSTANATNWYHAYSDDVNNGQSGVVRTEITAVDNITTPSAMGTADDGVYGFNDNGTWKRVYLLNSFYLQASGTAAVNGQDIYLQDLEAKVSDAAPAQELSKALRLLVKNGSTVSVFSPVAGATATYSVNGATSVTPVLASATAAPAQTAIVATNVNLPAYTAAGTNAVQLDVYIFFEGEDANCKSANIVASLERIAISFKFGNKAHA